MKNFFIFKGFCDCLKERFNTATFFFCIFRADKVRLLEPFLNSPFAEVSWVYESPKNLDESKFQIQLLQRGSRNRCLNKENWMEKSSDVWNGCFSRELRVWRVIIWGTEKVTFRPRLSENQGGDSYLSLCSKTALWKNMYEPAGSFRNILSIGKHILVQLVHILRINNQANNWNNK